MRKSALISSVALALACGSQALAQREAPPGAAPSDGASRPAATLPGYDFQRGVQSAQVTRETLGSANYLNSGDYGDALGSYRVVQGAQSYVHRVDTAEGSSMNEVPSFYTAYAEFLRRSGPANMQYPDGTVVRGLVNELQSARAPGAPTTSVGSRPSSRLEDAQTDALRNARPAATQQLALASALVSAARESGNSSYISRAVAMESEARAALDRLNGAVILSDSYHGRSFTNDGDALRYLAMRDAAMADVLQRASLDRVDSSNSFTNRSLALVGEMRGAFDGTNRNLGGPVNMLSATAISGVQDQVIQSRAANRVAENLMAASGAVDFIHLDMWATDSVRGYFARLRDLATDFGEDDLNHSVDTLTVNGARPPSGSATNPASTAGNRTTTAAADTIEQPRQPGGPDYPTARPRTAAERAAAWARDREQIDARNRAEAVRSSEEFFQAQRAAEAAAAREAARFQNERARLAAAAEARTAQDANWRAMVDASFRTFQSPGWGAFDNLDALQRGALYDAVWEAFERNGGNLTTLQLEDIYRGYNPLNAIPPAQSLSSASHSLSAVGRSLSAAGTPVRSGTDNYDDPAVQSLYEVLYGLTGRRRGPLGPSQDEIQTANMGDYDLYSDPTGRWGRESGGYVAASLFDNELDYLQRSVVNGRGGLSALLAQPFNVVLSWGAGAYDLDLHMTGPTGLGETDRFHIYFSATGSLTSFPFAALIRDCICNSGSEVILTTALLGGGVYRVSVFNFGDQSATSTNLSNASNATIQIVRGGVATPQGNGTTITGGRTILTTTVPNGQFGNTWVAVELDPRSGRITVPRTIVQTQGSADVR